ncbi:MAG: AraC family transcriptional regulator [Acidobacteria bacterium]|nr:MAG: AraC family transcriptional regulator [Acidobacteriota bacterium]REJ98416.1 MAG: AraC family transcriptional regulator [Acidobacteriota bacterium]REK17162.1 MAG: AraC family transcriptional regulator [Acidobacteriota bacterium]REK43072.1 MAG: AraC family transcriptional regulator [Acidobacteriota bacterium]
MLRPLGIDPDASVDPKLMVSAADYYAFLEGLAGVDKDPVTIPLRAGAAMRCDDYGAFGLAFKSATTLHGSYRRAGRYARVLTSVSTYDVEMTSRGGLMHLHRAGERTLGMRLSNEATIASIASISREVSSSEFKPLAVYFKHSKPKMIEEHKRYFGCPVHFGSDKDAVLVTRGQLNAPNRLGDKSISRFLDKHLETEVKELEESETLDQMVCRQISRSLSEGTPAISDIARQLGMSSRSLQRKLSEDNLTYRELMERSRRELARRLLQQTDYSLAEVAFMTGFSEQSAFSRAFKRWEGETPRSYRLDSSQGAA